MAVDSVPISVLPRAPATSGFKYPAIPNPGKSPEEMAATIRALKEAVELLTGQRGTNRALTAADLGKKTNPGTTTDTNNNNNDPGGYGLLDQALAEFNNIFNNELNDINTTLSNDIANTIAGYLAGDATIQLQLNTVATQAANTAAAVTTEIIARANGDSALAAQITTVSAVAGGKNAVFVSSSAPTATKIGDIWIDTLHNNLLKTWDGSAWVARQDGQIAANVAAIQTEAVARADADSAISASITTLTSQVSSNTSNITNEAATRATADTALSATITALTTTVGNQSAALTSEAAARSDADSALSGQITTATTQANNATASGSYRLISTTSTLGSAAEFAVELSATGGATWSNAGLRMQVLGGGTSRIVFNADKFIVDANGTAGTVFLIQGNTVYWNGLLKVNAIDTSSLIVDGVVITGKLAAAAATSVASAQAGNVSGTVSNSTLISPLVSKVFSTTVGNVIINTNVYVTSSLMTANVNNTCTIWLTVDGVRVYGISMALTLGSTTPTYSFQGSVPITYLASVPSSTAGISHTFGMEAQYSSVSGNILFVFGAPIMTLMESRR